MCQESLSTAGHGIYIASPQNLAVTLKSRENRAFADCLPHRNRTVRYSNPIARSAIHTYQSQPSQPWQTVRLKSRGHTELQMLCLVSGVSWRIVRTPGVDCMPFILSAPPEPSKVLEKKLMYLADRPHNRTGPSAIQYVHTPLLTDSICQSMKATTELVVTPVLEANRMHLICAPGSSSHTYDR
jgi:hypothetical protein